MHSEYTGHKKKKLQWYLLPEYSKQKTAMKGIENNDILHKGLFYLFVHSYEMKRINYFPASGQKEFTFLKVNKKASSY